MKEKFRLNIFKKFLISYLLFLVIFLLSGMISYRVADQAITDSSRKTSLMMLNQSKDFVDNLLKGIQNLSKEISTNDDLNTYVNGGQAAGVYNAFKAWKSLTPYHFSNEMILGFYLYTKTNDAILTPQGSYVRIEDFYGLYHYADMDVEQWKQSVLHTMHQDEILPSKRFVNKVQELNVITYMNSITLGHEIATLVVLIDEREVQKLLSRSTLEYGGWIGLADGRGQLIASYGELPDGDWREAGIKPDGSTIVIQTNSDYNGWTYIAGLSKDKVLSKALYIRDVTLYLLLITTVVGLAIALIFAYRNSAPLNELASLLKESIGDGSYKGKDGFDFLQGNVTQLIRNYRTLEEDMSKQAPVLREAYIGRLLSGRLTDREKEYANEQLDIRFQGHSGYVGILQLHGMKQMEQHESIEQLNVSRLIVHKLLKELFAQSMIVGDDQLDQLSFIWTCPPPLEQEAVQQWNENLQQLAGILSGQYGIQVSISIGGVFHTLTDLYRSYYEAKQAMENAPYSLFNIIWYDQLPTEMGILYYPIDLEMRLISSVKHGDWPEVGTILERIFEENLVARQVTGEMFKQLIFELKGTAHKLVSQLRGGDNMQRLQDLVNQISAKEAPSLVRSIVENVFQALCESAAPTGQHKDQAITERLVAYLQANYASSQLSLTLAADQVQLPEKYVSQVFKQHTGENFSVYLEKLRMQRATELLSAGEYTIEEIAERVGYNSAHAFRRVFKRVTGASPSVFRSLVVEES
ncbi:helix-turn-helix domain-containing protein [Paenibacillus sp. NPDC056579]|uniref:helix-turn-helix domain-containing protein n=1 Tax=Paenibacillus sp. NPDC056579 TaxID=3345871 RepID=UPI0036ADE941